MIKNPKQFAHITSLDLSDIDTQEKADEIINRIDFACPNFHHLQELPTLPNSLTHLSLDIIDRCGTLATT